MGVESVLKGIQDLLEEDSGHADYIFANTAIGTIGRLVSFILGIIIVILAIGIPVIIIFEICYINLPFIREPIDYMSDRYERAKKAAGLLLRDARKAVTEANTKETGQSANAIYFRIKIKTVFIAFLIIGVAINYNTVITIFTNIINSLIETIMRIS
ncbi:MAG: hypothetical protein IJ593_10730 [Lachnospiraceae bacterium]|nr:hypothetical protein [Lachnospiraceae bacterium]